MNPVERAIRRIDATQRRFTPTAFVFGVIKKYGDDNGGVLVSNLAYSSFVSIFPLLLILYAILGLIAAADPSFRESAANAKNAVADQIPLLGQTLASNVDTAHLQNSSTIGLIVGLLVLIYGVTGLAQAGLFTMEQVWNLPGPARPGYVQRLGRALLFLCLLGGGVIVTTGLAGLTNSLHDKSSWFHILIYVVTAAFSAGMYLGAFRALTPKGVPTRSLLPGAITGGILWTVLQVLGTWLVHRFLHSNSVYGVFATVLGLLAWIYLAIEITVYSAEINVVLARRLWPRSILQPPLTEADRASMALQALQNQRRPEQHVEVTFDDRPPGAEVPDDTPRTPDQVAPPALPADPAAPAGRAARGPASPRAALPAQASAECWPAR
ncbi:MAG TPA: YihY/virulence factor BrkB family protein, partial [Streptosporangiaceae bacterium]|nr:YihY/virulence factor BrkB family protein [Streptosporangiaceae bacterium]